MTLHNMRVQYNDSVVQHQWVSLFWCPKLGIQDAQWASLIALVNQSWWQQEPFPLATSIIACSYMFLLFLILMLSSCYMASDALVCNYTHWGAEWCSPLEETSNYHYQQLARSDGARSMQKKNRTQREKRSQDKLDQKHLLFEVWFMFTSVHLK